MASIKIHGTCRGLWLLGAVVSLACPSLSLAGGPSSHKINLHTLYGFKPGIPLAIVYADWTLTKPPTHNVPPFYVVPAYSPKNLPYNPDDPNTSPLEAPRVKGGPSYWNNKPYYGLNGLQPPSYYLSSYQAGESSNPALTNAADKVGYGRAFNVPANGYTTAGNAPALMVNLPTGDRPADIAAIAASKESQDASLVKADSAAAPPDRLVAFEWVVKTTSSTSPSAASRPSATQPTTTATTTATSTATSTVAAGGNPSVDRPTTSRSRALLLASAVATEDARHARANLPMPSPAK